MKVCKGCWYPVMVPSTVAASILAHFEAGEGLKILPENQNRNNELT